MLRDRIFDAIWSELDPLEQRIEDEEKIPNQIVLPILDRIGALGLLIPREYGGSGLSIAQYLPIIAEFAKVQGGLRVIVHVHNSFAHALSEIGSDEQKIRRPARRGFRPELGGVRSDGTGTRDGS